jgi:GMP synthase-like glutamine amidotransferase
MSRLKLALLDLYDGEPNQGMRAIREILSDFSGHLEVEEFDVRAKCQIPGTEFNIYISSGGPGHPLDGDGIWDARWKKLMDDLREINASGVGMKKYVFFICHSFQMICAHLGIGAITKRRKKSFGTFPVYKTEAGRHEPLFRDLSDPFWVADFREYQVIQPDHKILSALGANILTLEMPRPEPYERAIMAVRFSDEFVGTQFHPEGDPKGMIDHFLQPERREAVFQEFGEDHYFQMIADLDDPNKIEMTHNTVLPQFLHNSIQALRHQELATTHHASLAMTSKSRR